MKKSSYSQSAYGKMRDRMKEREIRLAALRGKNCIDIRQN